MRHLHLCFHQPAMAQQFPYCQSAKGCREEGPRPAGNDSERHSLSVVKLRYSNMPGHRETRCIVSTHEVLKICQPPANDIWENTVAVEANRITAMRNRGAFAGLVTQIHSLSPWRPLSLDRCDVDGDETWLR